MAGKRRLLHFGCVKHWTANWVQGLGQMLCASLLHRLPSNPTDACEYQAGAEKWFAREIT